MQISTFKMKKRCIICTSVQKDCDLCLTEKLHIIKKSMNPKSINKRTDISNKCIHKKLFYYKKMDANCDSSDFSDIVQLLEFFVICTFYGLFAIYIIILLFHIHFSSQTKDKRINILLFTYSYRTYSDEIFYL